MAKTVFNRTWAQLQVGDAASIERVCTERDLLLFALVSGNTNPLMLPAQEDAVAPVVAPIAPSMWIGSLISAVLGNILPGTGTLYRSQTFEFVRRVHIGDRLRVTVTCREKRAEPEAVFDTLITDMDGAPICKGVAVIDAPLRQVETPTRELPALIVEQKDHFAHLIAPNIEAGNMLAKELTFLAHAEAAGLVLGAQAPVMLTSRADNDRARLVSCALALLYDYWRRNGGAFSGEADKALAAE
jgi:acyl dehydratase